VDLNNFYASVECLYNPAIRNKPVVVCGDIEARHGIVLAKNYPAKALGIKTGESIWQARQKARDLIVVPPDFRKYLRFSQLARSIYAYYTDQIEPFGIDEAWLDVTGSTTLFGNGEAIANDIRRRIREELGLTISAGVSYNKVYAKLGSDLKKPDATTVISRKNYRDVVWPLPVGDLLYVGRSTCNKLQNRAIYTIGDLAQRNPADLRRLLGIWGETLYVFANGLDRSNVRKAGEEAVIKSIGNSTTAPRDLVNIEDVQMIVYVLTSSVATRLREQGLKCTGVSVYVRDNKLNSFERQRQLSQPTYLSGDIADQAMQLLRQSYTWQHPIRSIGVRGFGLVTANQHMQLDLFGRNAIKLERLEFTIDNLRRRFGYSIIGRASLHKDPKLTEFSPKDEHIIHPTSFF